MHSSRIGIVRCSGRLEGGGEGVCLGAVCPVGYLPGGCLPRGISNQGFLPEGWGGGLSAFGCLPRSGYLSRRCLSRRCLSRGCLPAGCLPSGVSAWGAFYSGGGYLTRGVFAWGGGCLPLGVCPEGGICLGGVCPGYVCLGGVCLRVCVPGGCKLSPSAKRMTNRCKNITFPQLRLRMVITFYYFTESRQINKKVF